MKRFTVSAIITFAMVFGLFYFFVMRGEAGQEAVSVVDEPSVQPQHQEAHEENKRKPSSTEPAMEVTLKPAKKLAMNTAVTHAHAKGERQKYSIQLASHQDRKKAESMLADLQAKGFAGDIQTATVKGTEYHRVRIGPYENKEKAQSALMDAQEALGYKDAILSNYN